ncbi:hypothetical protein I3842_13G148500 [Carya illinoinensis]|uniref:Uncharacterized protein n=1 Tax=Carya illinoinensis TaxID=32201 RepID=A0A922AMQ9_CARIL|nr:hypothetical protein I3842_13G148500 [Carya illinoinensis]
MHHLWVILSVKQIIMGLRKELTCFSILLLVLLLLKISSSVDGSATFGTFKTGSASKLRNEKSKGAFGRDKDEDGDQSHVFGDEKRRVYTGPNPLHNR